MMGAACVLHGIGQAVCWAKRRSRCDGWMEGCEAKRAVGRMEVCLEEEREKVPFLQLTESQTARHMAVLVDGQR